MSAYGFEIVQTLIVDIEPDEHVKRAMNEINAGILFLWSQIRKKRAELCNLFFDLFPPKEELTWLNFLIQRSNYLKFNI